MAKEAKKIELIKLTIQIGDTKVSVTKDEARDLHKALSEMFGEKTTQNHYHYDYSRPWYWPGWYGSSSIGGSLLGSSNLQALGASASDDRPTLTYSAGNVLLSAADYKVTD